MHYFSSPCELAKLDYISSLSKNFPFQKNSVQFKADVCTNFLGSFDLGSVGCSVTDYDVCAHNANKFFTDASSRDIGSSVKSLPPSLASSISPVIVSLLETIQVFPNSNLRNWLENFLQRLLQIDVFRLLRRNCFCFSQNEEQMCKIDLGQQVHIENKSCKSLYKHACNLWN